MIWITTQFEGCHHYNDAPPNVSFLKNSHRHLFKVKVWIEIKHNNRDMEFIMFKRFVEGLLQYNNEDKSCEMISDDLYKKIIKKYPKRKVCIEVSEDGENGSYKEYMKGGDL